MPSNDLFGRKQVHDNKPITADMCTIVWPGLSGTTTIAAATSINIQYSQQVTRRRTMGARGGSPQAVLYPSQPQGVFTMQRLMFQGRESLKNLKGFDVCKGTADINVNFNGEAAYEDCAVKGDAYILRGALVSSYSISAEAEGLVVMDNVTVDFLQMEMTENASTTVDPNTGE